MTLKAYSQCQSVRTSRSRASFDPQREAGKIRRNRSPDLAVSILELREYISMLQLEVTH